MNFVNVQFLEIVNNPTDRGNYAKFVCTVDSTDDVVVFAESIYDLIAEACGELGLMTVLDEAEIANNTCPNTDCIAITFQVPGSAVVSYRSQFAGNIGLNRIYKAHMQNGMWAWLAAQIAREATEIANPQ